MSSNLIYIGDGDFIPGVPARDLSAEEVTQYAEAIEANRSATGRDLYVLPADESEESE